MRPPLWHKYSTSEQNINLRFKADEINVMKLDRDQRDWMNGVQAEWRQRLEPASTPLGRHVFDVGPKVPGGAVQNALVFGSRFEALDALPKTGIIAEVGTQAGLFAEKILTTSMPSALHLFDIEFDTLRRERPKVATHPQVHLHLGDSSTELARLPNASFDWIYIDGDHAIEGVRKDTNVALTKLKRSGVLVFNDYTVWSPLEMTDYGVVPVVNELLASGGWEMVYIALHPLMYCDVALRQV